MNNRKKILITGVTGFIGTNLVKELLSRGHKVVGIDNFYASSRERLQLFADEENFRFLEADIRNPLEIEGEIDQIYNLACPASPPVYQKEPLYTLETNIMGMKNVLELAEEKGAKVLQASTSEVYGDPKKHPQKETYWGNVNPVGPRSCYDEGKRAAETFCLEYFNRGVDVRVARIFNTYGPYMSPDDGRVVTNFITQALNDEDLTIYGDGEQTRSFCFVDDLVRGLVKFMNYEGELFGPLNLGNPVEYTILELADKVLALLPESSSELTYEPLPEDDPQKRRPDISRAKQKLSWQPEVGLEEGLKKTLQYIKYKCSE
ncbi:MAG: UDP-glucuronic acid decarboxylase family protein [Patescibacteria group bacterium]|nr:UDP-glucuronic acid decarboxylase family protein [Patescibacteria group bacterium]